MKVRWMEIKVLVVNLVSRLIESIKYNLPIECYCSPTNVLIYLLWQSAVGYDYQEKVEKHESQVDGSKGFGGKFGVQTDRQDAAAVGFDEEQGHVGTTYEKDKPVIAGNNNNFR
jgi:hypothetical protein